MNHMALLFSVAEALPATLIAWGLFYLVSVRRHGVRPRWWVVVLHLIACAALAGIGLHLARGEENATLVLLLGLMLLCWLSCVLLETQERSRKST